MSPHFPRPYLFFCCFCVCHVLPTCLLERPPSPNFVCWNGRAPPSPLPSNGEWNEPEKKASCRWPVWRHSPSTHIPAICTEASAARSATCASATPRDTTPTQPIIPATPGHPEKVESADATWNKRWVGRLVVLPRRIGLHNFEKYPTHPHSSPPPEPDPCPPAPPPRMDRLYFCFELGHGANWFHPLGWGKKWAHLFRIADVSQLALDVIDQVSRLIDNEDIIELDVGVANTQSLMHVRQGYTQVLAQQANVIGRLWYQAAVALVFPIVCTRYAPQLQYNMQSWGRLSRNTSNIWTT